MSSKPLMVTSFSSCSPSPMMYSTMFTGLSCGFVVGEKRALGGKKGITLFINVIKDDLLICHVRQCLVISAINHPISVSAGGAAPSLRLHYVIPFNSDLFESSPA